MDKKLLKNNKKFLAALLAGALTLGSIPLTSFNASTAMEGEDLRPSESYSTPIERVVESHVYESQEALERDREALMEGFETGYVSVPEDPNEPIRAVREEDLEDADAPADGTKASKIVDITPYKGNPEGYFCFIKFKAKGSSVVKKHFTTMKRLKGSRDTNDYIYCLQMTKDNPPDGEKMEQVKRESDNLLAIMRLGFPRGANMSNNVVPKEIHQCFYRKDQSGSKGDDYRFWNYYITQAAIWIAIGDTTLANVKAGVNYGGAPAGIMGRVEKFYNLVPKYKTEWVMPKIWVSHKRKRAVVDEKDPSQLCTPNYEKDIAAAQAPKNVLKLMEKNVFTDAPNANGENRVPPAMEMTFPDGAPKGLRVLVWDKRTDKDRVYHIDQGQKPQLYGQDQFRFIIPNPPQKGEFTYKISGPCWTWRAYRYKAGNWQEMLKEDVVEFGQNIETEAEVFWELDVKPDKYSIHAKKVDEKTGAALQGAEFTLKYPSGGVDKKVTDSTGKVSWTELTQTGNYVVTETKAPPGYTLPPNASQVVTLPPDNGTTVTVTFRDEKITTDSFQLKAIKKDSADKKPLQGAEFTLTLPDGTTRKGTSNVNGEVIFANLTKTGKYIIEETRAPQGYELAKNPKQEVNVTNPKNPPVTEFEFLNDKSKTPKYEITATKVDKADKKPLQGATFELTGANNFKQEAISGVDGVVRFTNLEKGTYTLTETKAPAGYQLAENPTQTVTVPGATQALVFENEKIPEKLHEITATKVDAKDKKPLRGATFELTGPNDFKQEAVTGEDGTVIFKDLKEGTYTLTETKPPEGYTLAKNPSQKVEVPGNTTGLIFENEKIPDKGRVELLKYDSITNKALEGVEFELYKKSSVSTPKPDKPEAKATDGEDTPKPDESTNTKPDEITNPKPGEDILVGKFTTDANGKIVVENLDPGDYYFIETKGLEGYKPDSSKLEFTIPNEGGTIELTKSNTPDEASVEITKTDVSTGKPLAGAKIKIYAEDKETVLAEGITDSNGKFAFGPLKPGKYYFQESGAPEGYVLDETLFPFEVKPGGEIVKCTMTNKPIEGSVEITKTDVSTGEVIAGAHIKIYAEDKETVLAGGVTDENGKFTFGPLKPGKYYYQESGAPEGYVLDDTLYPFEVKENGEIVKCTMTNKPIKGTLEITKVDISDGKLLPNAHFIIYDENKNQVVKGVTDSNGIAKFELGYGKYYYQEYDAPVGYQLDDTLFPFEIKTDGEIVKCRMTNVPKPVPALPTTGANIAAGSGLIAAVGAVASAIFRKWL